MKNNFLSLSKRFILILLVCTLLFTPAIPAFASGAPGDAKKIILEIFEYIERNHISGPDEEQLMNGAIRGMIDTLEDPYTDFLTGEDLKRLTDDMNGNYGGVGIYLEGRPDYPVVQEVFASSPASEAGIIAGDIIKKVNGTDIKGWPLYEVVEKIKGPAETEVILAAGRGGAELTFRLKRAYLNVPTVDSKRIGKNTGYITVKSFGENTSRQFIAALENLQSQNIKGLVIDVRNNPGGYLNAALEMAEMFVEPDTPLLITRNQSGSESSYSAGKDIKRVGIPTVVLVNSQSASSAEIFAGALQDNAIPLVGQKTYGKGVAQSIIKLSTGGALKITTNEYTTPKGRQVNKLGLKPDFEVFTPGLQLPFALGMLEPEKRQVTFNGELMEATVGSETLPVKNKPLVREGVAYLPLRFTLEALGWVVSWDQESGGITARKGDLRAVFPPSGSPVINGREEAGGGRILFEEGTAYIPSSLVRTMGITVGEDGGRITVGD